MDRGTNNSNAYINKNHNKTKLTQKEREIMKKEEEKSKIVKLTPPPMGFKYK